jgi:hypothetical protein
VNRRKFIALAASGLLVPEWLLDPPKGRSMVSVPGPIDYVPDPIRHGSSGEEWVDYVEFVGDIIGTWVPQFAMPNSGKWILK